MHDAWEKIDEGWQALQQPMIEVGIMESSGEEILLLNVGGSLASIGQPVLSVQGAPEPVLPTLARLFSRVWDKRLPRDEDGFIVLDESPACVKYFIHLALLKALDTSSVATTKEALLLGDGLPLDEKAYLPYVFRAIGVSELRSTVLDQAEYDPLGTTILNWCPSKPSELELIYRASRDGWAPKNFREKCGDDSPSTVTLYRVSTAGPGSRDSVVGGFSSLPWTLGKSPSWRSSPGAFVFMLKDGTRAQPASFKPVKWGTKEGKSAEAVYHHAEYGPNFGGGNLRVTRGETSPGTLCTGNSRYNAVAAFVALNGSDVLDVETFRVGPEKTAQSPPEPEIKPGLIEIPTIDIATMSAESGREDDIRTFGVSIADSLMEERVALRQAHDDLAEANANAAKSSNALAAVYGPHVAAGEGDTVIELSVRGTRMTTLRSTLQACPDSALAARFDEEKWPATEKDVDERGRRVMDCSPSVFSKVLDVLRMKKRVAWGGGGDERSLKVVVKATDRAAFEEFVGMYFPGCESFIMDSVAGAPLGSTAGS